MGRLRRFSRVPSSFPGARPGARMLVLGALVATANAVPVTAHAQAARDPAAAGAAFSRARDAIKRGDVELACELFASSVRLDPLPGAKLNLADCDERRGRVASASQEFKDALESLPSGDSRIPYAQERLQKLAPRIPKLVLRGGEALPPDARVSRDGQPVAAVSFGTPVPVDPRAHEIRVHAPGHVDTVQIVSPREGESVEVELRLGRPAPLEAPLIGPAPAPAPPPGRALPLALLTAGGVATVGGAIVGVLTVDRASTVDTHCTPRCDAVGLDAGRDGRWMSVVSPIALGVGVALLAAGIYLFVDAGKARARGDARPVTTGAR